jgi:predicted MFS family arabinose efflux permease
MVALQGQGSHLVRAAVLLGAALASLVGFIGWQRRMLATGREPLMNLALFGNRPFAMGSVVAFIYGTALFGSTYLLPVYMQLGLNLSASHAGTVLLPAGIVLAATIAIVGRLADQQPTWLLVMVGLGLLAASFSLMMTLKLSSALWLLALWTTLGRIGLGFILPSLNLGSLRPLPTEQVSQGASTISFVRMLGGAIGVSLCGIVLEWRLAAHGDSLAIAASSPARLAAFNESFLMLAALCVVAMAAASQLRVPPAPSTKD